MWHDSFDGAPADGSAWLDGGDPSFRVIRGSSSPLGPLARSRRVYYSLGFPPLAS